MYQQYFSLNELPFSIAPDPRYLYMSERHREALAHLLYGLKSNGAFILLTGDVGTGKTTVSRCLLEQLPAGTRLAMVLNPMLSALELLQAMSDELQIPRPDPQNSIKAHVDAINRDLLAAYARGEHTVVLIDEAQNLAPDVLEQLRLLTNLETAERKLLQVILLGQPELRTQLAQPAMSQLSQRITARYHLEPLNLAETRAYVQHRLLVAGCRAVLFGDACLRQLHGLSRGVPRLINVICDRALLGAYVSNKAQVNVAILQRAALEVLGEQTAASNWRRNMTIAAVLLLVITGLVWGWFIFREQRIVKIEMPVTMDAVPAATAMVKSSQPIQESSVAVVQADIVWPETGLALRSHTLSFQKLFALWKLDYQPDMHGAPCYFAQLQALACVSESGDWLKLAAYNHPVILKLYDAHGDAHYATLIKLQDGQAQLDIAGGLQQLLMTGLQQHWRGEFMLLWRPPAGYQESMHVGYVGRDVVWLRQQLNRIFPEQRLPEIELYDAELSAMVRQFQQDQGLLADGMAGVQTVMRLQAFNGASDPGLRLNERSG